MIVFDEAYVLFHFNIILNRMYSTKTKAILHIMSV